METWFREMDRAGILTDIDRIQAFADDQIVILGGHSLADIERKWEAIWGVCERWATTNRLMYNTDKTEIMHINRKKTREPRLKLDGRTITVQQQLTYLGLTFDTKGQWIEHIKKTRTKTTETANRLFIITGRTWGTKTDILKTIYETAIKPMILYGSEVWGDRAKDTRIIKHLRAMERPFLLAITKAYRTAPTSALHVLAGCVPLQVEAEWNHRGNDRHTRQHTYILRHPTRRTRLTRTDDDTDTDITIYTDASTKTGSATIAWTTLTNGQWTDQGLKVKTDTDINALERLAIREALHSTATNTKGQGLYIKLLTDSQQALLSINNPNSRHEITRQIQKIQEDLQKQNTRLTINKTDRQNPGLKRAHNIAARTHERQIHDIQFTDKKTENKRKNQNKRETWQRLWENCTDGRTTYKFIKTVTKNKTDINWKTTQLLTGHGHMSHYYNRFRLRDTDGNCECNGSTEDSGHIINECTKPTRTEARQTLTNELTRRGLNYPPTNVDPTDKTLMTLINDWGDKMIEDDDKEDENTDEDDDRDCL